MPVPTPPVFSKPLNTWNAGEDVLNTDWNALVNYVLALGLPVDDARLDQSAGQILQRFAAFADSFKVTATNLGSSLALSYTGGVVRLTSGLIATVAPGTLTAPAPSTGTGTSFVWISNGVVSITGLQAVPPSSGLLLAQITTNPTAITAVADLRSLYTERRDSDHRLIEAQKSTNTPLTIGGVELGIPGWSASRNIGNLLDTSTGVILPTVPLTDIRIDASVQIVCDVPANLSGKLSLYSGGVELKILSEITTIGVAGATRLTLSGFFETIKGEVLGAGQPLTLQVKIASGGTNSRIPISRNTQLILSQR